MDSVALAISNIIKEQQVIIGPVALDQAKKVSGLSVSSLSDVTIAGNKKQVLESLVKQYAKLFGNASVEVCKEAFNSVSSDIPASDVPDILKR